MTATTLERRTSSGKPRRRNNEGSYMHRADGMWRGAITDARGHRRTFYAKTFAAVQVKVNAAIEQQRKGLPVENVRITMAALLADWLRETRPRVRPSTYDCYEPQVRLYLIPALGRLRLARLQPEALAEYYAERIAAGLSPRTVRLHHTILSMAIRQAMRRGQVARNVAQLVTPPRQPRQELKILSPAQAGHLLDIVRGDRLEALYVLALSAGLRRGEICALQWGDLDLDAAVLHVRATLTRVDGSWQRTEPKTASSRRTVGLTQVATEALRRHHVRQAEERLLAGTRWSDGGFVFTTTVGTPVDGSKLLRLFHGHLERAGLPKVTFHALRHCTASYLLAAGINPKVVAELLGHSEVGTTLDTYSHLLPHLQQESALRMDALLRSVTTA